MLSVYTLKPRFQAALRPVVAALASCGVTANQVTLFAVLLSIISGGLIVWQPHAHWPLLLLPLVLFFRMALNAIDGMLAREYLQQSNLGAILNEMGDAISDVALYLPLALLPKISATLVVLVVLTALLTEMVGVVALQIGASRQYQGPMGKSDRAVWIGGLSLILGCGVAAGAWVNAVLCLIWVLSLVTVVNRAKAALAEAKNTHAS